jgi:flagellar motor switch protein FliN/FliY
MPLSEDLKANLSKIIDTAIGEAAGALSLLTGQTITIKIARYNASKINSDVISVDENSYLIQAPFDNKDLGQVSIIVGQPIASAFGSLMMGANTQDESEETKQQAFQEAAGQAINAAVNKVQSLKTSVQISVTQATYTLLDPAQAETLKAPESVKDPTGIDLEVGIPGKSSGIIRLELNTDTVNYLIAEFGNSTQESQSTEESTVSGSISGVSFAEMTGGVNPDVDIEHNLSLLMDIKMGLIVELGRAEMPLKDILKLAKGSVVELDRLSGEPVDLFVNNKLIARGEVVVIDDSFGLRITQLAGNLSSMKEVGGMLTAASE